MEPKINRRNIWPLAALLLTCIYLIIAANLPSEVPASDYDDELFIKHALSIGKGEWIGIHYDQFSLIKGPLHSVNLAIAKSLGLYQGLWLRCLYAVSALAFCSLCLPGMSTLIRAFSLFSFYFDPWLISTDGGIRLLREATYVPVQIIAITAAVYTFDRLFKVLKGERLPIWPALLSFSISGFSFGLLLITREARIVVYVTAVIALAIMGLMTALNKLPTKRIVYCVLSSCLCFAILFNTPLASIRIINNLHYGLPISNEFEDGEFKNFYEDLISVRLQNDNFIPWVPIKQSTLNKIHEVAPSTTLAKVIEHLNPAWKQPGCSLRSDVCGEYAGGWFMWAWRSAVFDAYSPADPKRFQEIIKRSQAELKHICSVNSVSLNCSRNSFGYLPLPSRWGGHEHPELTFLRSFFRLSFGLINADYIKKPFQYGPQSQPSKPAKRLGVLMATNNLTYIHRLNSMIQHLRNLSNVTRYAMVFTMMLLVLSSYDRALLIVADPGFWLIFISLMMQLLILVLVQITSFESTLYLTMASPLLTMVCWRTIAKSRPLPTHLDLAQH